MSNTPYFDEYEARRNSTSINSTINASIISEPNNGVYYSDEPLPRCNFSMMNGYYAYSSEYRLKKQRDDNGNLIDVNLERNVNGRWETVQE